MQDPFEIMRRSDGSIATDHYAARASAERRAAIGAAVRILFAGVVAFFGRTPAQPSRQPGWNPN